MSKKHKKTITIDFDGTIVEHRFPSIGRPVPGAFEWMKRFKELGATLILLTMRSDKHAARSPDFLSDAVAFCRQHGVEFDYVNDNPEQLSWTSSRKIYSHIHIDDTNAGCPMRGGCVDWSVIGPWVEAQLLLGVNNNPITPIEATLLPE